VGDPKSPRERRPIPKWWWAVSLFLVACGLVGIIFLSRGQTVGPSISKPFGDVTVNTESPSSTTTTVKGHATTTTLGHGPTTSAPTTSSPVTTTTPKVVVAPAVGRSRPVHLSIPGIGVSVRLGVLGLNRDGSVQVPKDYAAAGWYKYGVTPGQRGSAVILGHVDSFHGPAIFYRLADLRLGSRIYVKLANGRTLHFAVIGMRMYPKVSFPDRLVYGQRGYPALQLVTCGGVFDSSTGHYLSNIVVFSALVKS
jgi:hypothetical protein